jgi:hypothetical protein
MIGGLSGLETISKPDMRFELSLDTMPRHHLGIPQACRDSHRNKLGCPKLIRRVNRVDIDVCRCNKARLYQSLLTFTSDAKPLSAKCSSRPPR